MVELDMNDNAIEWLVDEITGKIPLKNKRKLADARGLRDRQVKAEEEGEESTDSAVGKYTVDEAAMDDSEDAAGNEPLEVIFSLDLQKYLEPKVVAGTNKQVDELIKFDRMLHGLDEEKKKTPFDEGAYPKLDWNQNQYELFAVIYEPTPGHYVSYVLKENSTQWYLIDEDRFRTCEKDEVATLTRPEMQFFRKRGVKADLAAKLEELMREKNRNLGVSK